MTLTATPPTTTPPAPTMRGHARAAGVFYLLTFASSIPALWLLGPVLDHAGYVTGAGDDTRVLWGCLLDTVNALTAIGSAVALYPVVKRQNTSLALGFVTSRMLEGAVVMIGVCSLMAVVAMRQDLSSAGGDAASLTTAATALVDVRNATFLMGPGLMPVFNAVLLGTLLYRARLVPRAIPALGLVGAPLLMVAFVLGFFGVVDQVSGVSGVLTVPVALWELSVGLWLTFRGFTTSPVLAD